MSLQRLGLEFDHLSLTTQKPEKMPPSSAPSATRPANRCTIPLTGVDLVLCRNPCTPDIHLFDGRDQAAAADSPGAAAGDLSRLLPVARPRCLTRGHEAAGQRVIRVSDPKPAVLFDNRQVSFHMVRGFGPIEVLETRK
jgi:methylmalonyl-CoA/ethylmalonyl-CoA epimerase